MKDSRLAANGVALAPRSRVSEVDREQRDDMAQCGADIATLAQVIANSREQLRHAIAEVAYFRAQRRGFAPGHELEDWLAAEEEILGEVP